jgi:hypothetical protein
MKVFRLRWNELRSEWRTKQLVNGPCMQTVSTTWSSGLQSQKTIDETILRRLLLFEMQFASIAEAKTLGNWVAEMERNRGNAQCTKGTDFRPIVYYIIILLVCSSLKGRLYILRCLQSCRSQYCRCSTQLYCFL